MDFDSHQGNYLICYKLSIKFTQLDGNFIMTDVNINQIILHNINLNIALALHP